MARKQASRTTHKAIVAANLALFERLCIDPDEAASTCWGCRARYPKRGGGKPTRAHVLARKHGGSDGPENFFLLCDVCHEEQPDGLPRAEQERWLAEREHHLARTERVTTEMIAALQAEADAHPRAAHDPTLAFKRWAGGEDQARVYAHIRRGYIHSGSNSIATARANATWNLRRALRRFLDTYDPAIYEF